MVVDKITFGTCEFIFIMLLKFKPSANTSDIKSFHSHNKDQLISQVP